MDLTWMLNAFVRHSVKQHKQQVPEVGSSRKRMAGWVTSSQPIDTRRFCPPLMPCGIRNLRTRQGVRL
jgi:hypothetical protein